MLHLLLPPTLPGAAASMLKAGSQAQNAQPTVADIWIWAIVILVIFLALAIISAFLVNFRPGGGDKAVRRIWFWILGILTPVASFLVNYFTKLNDFSTTFAKLGPAKIKAELDALTMHNVYSTIAVFVAFIVIGWLLSVVFKRTKLGTWF